MSLLHRDMCEHNHNKRAENFSSPFIANQTGIFILLLPSSP
jgi:hypothetical protein